MFLIWFIFRTRWWYIKFKASLLSNPILPQFLGSKAKRKSKNKKGPEEATQNAKPQEQPKKEEQKKPAAGSNVQMVGNTAIEIPTTTMQWDDFNADDFVVVGGGNKKNNKKVSVLFGFWIYI